MLPFLLKVSGLYHSQETIDVFFIHGGLLDGFFTLHLVSSCMIEILCICMVLMNFIIN